MVTNKEILQSTIIPDTNNKYLINEQGQVISLKQKVPRYIQQYMSHGYKQLNLNHSRNNRERIYLHTLLARTFLLKKHRSLTQVDHIDRNRINNSIDNLRYITPRLNLYNRSVKVKYKQLENGKYRCFHFFMNKINIKEFDTLEEVLSYKQNIESGELQRQQDDYINNELQQIFNSSNMRVILNKSTNKGKKYSATIMSSNDQKIATIHFGANQYEDYTTHKDKDRQSLYIKRHQKNEQHLWTHTDSNLQTPSYWSRYLLWQDPDINKAIKHIEQQQNINIINQI